MSFTLFDKYGVENCKIVLLEKVNVSTKEELLAIEGNYMKILIGHDVQNGMTFGSYLFTPSTNKISLLNLSIKY